MRKPAGSVEHVRLVDDELVPDGLEVQPADVVAADVFAAVAGPVRLDVGRLDAAGGDVELLLAAPLQRDEPERRTFDAVAAGGQ